MHFVERELRAAGQRVRELSKDPNTSTPDMSSLEYEYEQGRVSKKELEKAEAKVQRVFLLKLEAAGKMVDWFRERDGSLLQYLDMQQTLLKKVVECREHFDAQPREGNVSPGFQAALASDMQKAIAKYLAGEPTEGLWIAMWLPGLLDFFNEERMKPVS